MLKRIIFDLDNTLIPWKPEYSLAFKQVISDYQLNIDYKRLGELTSIYERSHTRYTLEEMAEQINNLFRVNITKEFVSDWLKYMANMSDENPKLTELLKYLSMKYELVVLTNWFYISQYKRLQKAKIDQYFKEIIGGDEFVKPYPESYQKAMGNNKPEECLMVGDSYEIDIKGAIDLGMQAILISKERMQNIETIDDIYKLKRIL